MNIRSYLTSVATAVFFVSPAAAEDLEDKVANALDGVSDRHTCVDNLLDVYKKQTDFKTESQGYELLIREQCIRLPSTEDQKGKGEAYLTFPQFVCEKVIRENYSQNGALDNAKAIGSTDFDNDKMIRIICTYGES